jgi:Uma2 family endonuclease
VATKTGLTIEDFERLPLEAAENRELVDGELVDVSGNIRLHIKLRDRVLFLLLSWLNSGHIGDAAAEQEYDFLGNAHAPDVSFEGPEKMGLIDNFKRVQRYVPDIAIEIVSPNDTFSSLVRKKERYRRAGTLEVWLISPDTYEVYIYSALGDRILHSGDTLTSPLLPGFSLVLEDLFRGL